mmetsp:Transcript_22615/g.28977  ORF Transcript_22615/g.28977 Transcript_22615/m.28977 type:complete len:83 (+) Transcript_22615:181-429(+)
MRRTSSFIWQYESNFWGESRSIEDTEGKERGCAVGLQGAVGTVGLLLVFELWFRLGNVYWFHAGGECPIVFLHRVAEVRMAM